MSGDKKASLQSFLLVRGQEGLGRGDRCRRRWSRSGCTRRRQMMVELLARCRRMGGVLSGTIGVQGHYANGLAALYLACGQDVGVRGRVGRRRDAVRGDGRRRPVRQRDAAEHHGRHGRRRHRRCRASGRAWTSSGWRRRASADALAEVCGGAGLAGELSIIGALVRRRLRRAHQTLARGVAPAVTPRQAHERRDGRSRRQPDAQASRWTSTSASGSRCSGHGPLIAAFSFSRRLLLAHCCAASVATVPSVPSLLVAFVTSPAVLPPAPHRRRVQGLRGGRALPPYRPVPRGLVTLRELGWLAVAVARCIQLALALWLAPPLAGAAAARRGSTSALMSKEFFVATGCARAPFTVPVAHGDHAAGRPLRDGVRLARGRPGAPPGSGCSGSWSSATSTGMVDRDRPQDPLARGRGGGRQTPTARSGAAPRRCSSGSAVMTLTTICRAARGARSRFDVPVVARYPGVLICRVALVDGSRFLRRRGRGRAKRIETLAGVWTIGMYLARRRAAALALVSSAECSAR